jgi:hypothetical protein
MIGAIWLGAVALWNLATVPVFVGMKEQPTVRIPTSELGRPEDLAFDRRKGLLFASTWLGGDWHVRSWNDRGAQLSDWRPPDFLQPLGLLYVNQGALRTVCWDKRQRNWAVLSLIDRPQNRLRIEYLTVEVKDYDRTLDHQTTDRVRNVMKSLRWYQRAYGAGSPDFDHLHEWFPVNSRPTDVVMAWTEEFEVVAFGWESLATVDLAFQDGEGNYCRIWVLPFLLDALRKPPNAIPTDTFLLATAVSPEGAAYGLLTWNQGANTTEPVVLRFRFIGQELRLVRKEPGFLARLLERY